MSFITRNRMVFLSPDAGGGGGGLPAAPPAPPAPAPAAPPAPAPTAPPTDPAAPPTPAPADPKVGDPAPDGKTFTQSDVDKIVADRLAQEKRVSKKAQDDAAEKARKDEMVAKEQFKELATLNETKATEAEARVTDLTTQLETANAALSEYVAADLKRLPVHMQELLKNQPPASVLKYIAQNRAALFPASPTPTPDPVPPVPVPGDPIPTPAPNDATLKKQNENDVRGFFR